MQLELYNSIDLGRIAGARSQTEPFVWGVIDDVFRDRAFAQKLAASFPDHLAAFERTHGSKRLRYRGVLLDEDAKQAPAEVDPVWFDLMRAIDTTEFRQALSTFSGMDLLDTDMDGGLWVYDKGCFFGPHTDRPTRLATLLFYLTPDWKPEWGGALSILYSQDAADRYESIPPIFNRCAFILRSDTSWHAVEPVTADGQQRRTFAVRLFRSGARRSLEPVLTWRLDFEKAKQEAAAFGLDLLVFESAEGTDPETALALPSDVVEIVHRRFVPVVRRADGADAGGPVVRMVTVSGTETAAFDPETAVTALRRLNA